MDKQYKNFPFPIPEEKGSIVSTPEGRIVRDANNPIDASRPTIITVLCGYFFVNWCLKIVSWLALLSQSSGGISFNFSGTGQLSAWVGSVISIIAVASIFGYWFMRKWGVYLYTAAIVFNLVYLLFRMSSFSSMAFLGFLLPIVVIIVGFLYLERMY